MDTKRAIMLLEKAHELLERQEHSSSVLNLLEEKVHYDGIEGNGSWLMDDIGILLDEIRLLTSDDEMERW